MKKIGITGGIGSGKTIVCKFIETLNYPVFYADIEAKKILDFDIEAKNKIIDAFGDVYKNGTADRKKIASIVFNNKSMLEKLNSIVHPKLLQNFDNWCLKKQQNKLVFMEAAILFENNFQKCVDLSILVYAPLQKRIERASKRDKINKLLVLERIKNQSCQEDLIEIADFLLINDDQHLIVPQIIRTLDILKK